MHQRLQAEHAFAFGINLQGHAPAGDLEHRQIIRRFLDHDSPTPGRAVLAVKSGPSFALQESLDALDPQRCTTAVDHRLEHLLHPSSALKQQVAAIFGLVDRVLVVKFAPLLPTRAKNGLKRANSSIRHPLVQFEIA